MKKQAEEGIISLRSLWSIIDYPINDRLTTSVYLQTWQKITNNVDHKLHYIIENELKKVSQ